MFRELPPRHRVDRFNALPCGTRGDLSTLQVLRYSLVISRRASGVRPEQQTGGGSISAWSIQGLAGRRWQKRRSLKARLGEPSFSA